MTCSTEFLSTFPLRGTSLVSGSASLPDVYFYPRSPCGERRFNIGFGLCFGCISIHVPLAGNVVVQALFWTLVLVFLSTFPLRGTSRTGDKPTSIQFISIHVPLAGNVVLELFFLLAHKSFLSTFPLRGTSVVQAHNISSNFIFLSTFPLRGTSRSRFSRYRIQANFYPRSPCGERRSRRTLGSACPQFLSTFPLRGTSSASASSRRRSSDFYPRSPCGERPGCHSRT